MAALIVASIQPFPLADKCTAAKATSWEGTEVWSLPPPLVPDKQGRRQVDEGLRDESLCSYLKLERTSVPPRGTGDVQGSVKLTVI